MVRMITPMHRWQGRCMVSLNWDVIMVTTTVSMICLAMTHRIVMTMTSEQLLTLTQWLSPAFPVGSFAWSHGLEQAVASGEVTNAATLADWLDVVLTLGAGRNDAILLVAAYHAADPAVLSDVGELADALAPSLERKVEAQQQGAAFAATVRQVWALDIPDVPYVVAIGRAAALVELPVVPVTQVFLLAFVTNLVQAAQRLMPLGQTEAQRVIHILSRRCAEVAATAASSDLDALGSAAFAVDIAAMHHEELAPRLFRS